MSTKNVDQKFELIASKMRSANLSQIAIEQFYYYYMLLHSGATGTISEGQIDAVESLPDASSSDISSNEELSKIGSNVLDHTCVIKLNGGLGTGMGLNQAKSLLEVTDGLSFLDIIIRQCLTLRKRYNCSVPLMFMNSFRTEEDTLAVLRNYTEFDAGQDGLTPSFLQNKVPRLLQDSLEPIDWPEDKELEWCPPGHGDIYTALSSAGILDELLAKGYKYLFISNADNLGAELSLEILGYFAQNGFPFMMEVADRTEVDKKGGHLALSLEGNLILRESAQCPEDETTLFQDIRQYKYFNTNTLWLNLEALALKIKKEGFLKLPLIVNSKHVHPEQLDSPKVFQLETAMGAAISLFSGAQALRVPRTRFAPVKKTNDLLTLRSDYFTVSENFSIVRDSQAKDTPPIIELDPRYYSTISDFEKRFPKGTPSLLNCRSLRIVGDVVFGSNISLEGDVVIENKELDPLFIEDNSRLGD